MFKNVKAPHTFVLLVGLIILAVIATHFVPAGSFERFKDAETGRTLVKAGSFAFIKSNPASLWDVPAIIYKGIVKSASIVTFILIIGGAFEIIIDTKVFSALAQRVSKLFTKRRFLVIPAFVTLFSIFGTTMGMSTEVMIFVPIGIVLAESLGLDRVTGTAMIAMGAAIGFTSGVLNPFSVGVAQSIAQLPLFSGSGYRIFILICLIIITSLYIMRYAKRVMADPTKSIVYGEENPPEFELEKEEVPLDVRMSLSLLAIVIGMGVLIYGLVKLDWYYEEMSGLFLTLGVVVGLIAGYDVNKIAKIFGRGCANICVGALIIGFARGIEVVLGDAKIIDTIVYYLSNIVDGMPSSLQAVGMFLIQSLINCVIVSGSGQAVVTMPLMTPLADIIGMSRQTAVLAFQLGDGFSNSVLPTSSSLMGFLVVSRIPYTNWLKFMMPLFILWTLAGCVFMVGAVLIGY